MVAQLRQFFRVFAIEAAAAELAGLDLEGKDDRTSADGADAVQPGSEIETPFQ
jgi:hypothetical protein